MAGNKHIQIVDFPEEDEIIAQAAAILYAGFKDIWPHICPDLETSLIVVQHCLQSSNINRLTLGEDGMVLGWIGAIPEYAGNAWCIYPLVVHSDCRRQGIGRSLVRDLEQIVAARGAITIFLGTDDTLGMTTLGNTDIYPNVLERLANIENLDGHPFQFYQKLGFTVTGVIPDATGLGKPDILMAKRIAGLS